MTREDVINNIMVNYQEYGIDREWMEESIRSGEEQGFSYQTIYTGLRMALGSVTGQEELFTVAEMAGGPGGGGRRNCTPDRRIDRGTAGSRGGYGTVFPTLRYRRSTSVFDFSGWPEIIKVWPVKKGEQSWKKVLKLWTLMKK